MRVFVDTEGLAGAGTKLATEASPIAPPPVQPAAADPVSLSLAAILGARLLTVSTLLAHGDIVRNAGGMTLTGTAAGFTDVDDDNAAPFSGAAPNGSSAVPATLISPPAPTLPPLPAMPVPPTMPGDVFGALVHDGPGGSALRASARLLRGQVVAAIRDQADDVMRTGNGIDAAWQDDGRQRAGTNTFEHGGWLHQMADQTETVAAAFDESADHLDNTRQVTPTSEEFQLARQNLANAQATHNPVAFAQAAANYSRLNARATEAMLDYHGQASATTAALDTPLRPAPAIAGGGDNTPSGPDDTIVGSPNPNQPHIQPVDRFAPIPQDPAPTPPPSPPVTGDPIKLPPKPPPPVQVIDASPHDGPANQPGFPKCPASDNLKHIAELLGGAAIFGISLPADIPSLGAATPGLISGLYMVYDGFDELRKCTP